MQCRYINGNGEQVGSRSRVTVRAGLRPWRSRVKMGWWLQNDQGIDHRSFGATPSASTKMIAIARLAIALALAAGLMTAAAFVASIEASPAEVAEGV
jgi:hypothetical protein